MDEYVCLTVKSNPGESEAAFTARMASFWTHMVRNKPDDYEKVYAEATKFEKGGDKLTRQYMLEAGVASAPATPSNLDEDLPAPTKTLTVKTVPIKGGPVAKAASSAPVLIPPPVTVSPPEE